VDLRLALGRLAQAVPVPLVDRLDADDPPDQRTRPDEVKPTDPWSSVSPHQFATEG
jgi:hypothetical protein